MQRLGGLIGRPVLSQDAGTRIGEVADFLLAGDRVVRVVGIVLAGGLISSEHVLPFGDVRVLGEDAVIAATATSIVGPKAWKQSGVTAQRLSSLRKRAILTTGGQTLGVVGDVYADSTGAVAGYDVETRGFGGLVKKHDLLPPDGVTLGPQALVVSEEAALAFSAAPRS